MPPASVARRYRRSRDWANRAAEGRHCEGVPLPASGPNAAPNPDSTTHGGTSVLAYLAFFPLPNLPNSVNGDTGLFVSSPVHQLAQNYKTARLEHGLGDDDLL